MSSTQARWQPREGVVIKVDIFLAVVEFPVSPQTKLITVLGYIDGSALRLPRQKGQLRQEARAFKPVVPDLTASSSNLKSTAKSSDLCRLFCDFACSLTQSLSCGL
jgi:hypothetical protein